MRKTFIAVALLVMVALFVGCTATKDCWQKPGVDLPGDCVGLNPDTHLPDSEYCSKLRHNVGCTTNGTLTECDRNYGC